jgi:chromosome segregation ATPase
MSFSDEDKTYLFETIGGIVAAATTGIQQDVTLMRENITSLKEDVTLLREDITSLKEDVTLLREDMSSLRAEVSERFDRVDERFDRVDERLTSQEADILAIRTHTAALSRDMMSSKNRKDREHQELSDRVTTLELAFKELTAQIGSKPS